MIAILGSTFEKTLHFLTKEKKNGDMDTDDVLFMKGQIRKEEARMASHFVGIKPENIHFLELPFYETGKIQKDKLSDKDVLKIIPLLQEIQPHQIYLAGDLADPHGTHKICLDAALAAIYELQKRKLDERLQDMDVSRSLGRMGDRSH